MNCPKVFLDTNLDVWSWRPEGVRWETIRRVGSGIGPSTRRRLSSGVLAGRTWKP